MQALVEADLKMDGFLSVDGELDLAIKELRKGAKGIVPFHWEFEFPEVFTTGEHGSGRGGFDANRWQSAVCWEEHAHLGQWRGFI